VTTLCGYGTNVCNAGQLQVVYGCATRVEYQGTRCGSGLCKPDKNGRAAIAQPINLTSGNMFESATDFETVGQSPLTARRYYNSYLAYAPNANGYDSSYNSLYSVLNSRFGYAWRSEYDRFIVPNNGNPNSATAVDAIRADGEPVHFAKNGGTWYVA